MALTASSIGSGSGTASSWTSASFTCSAGDLLIVGVAVGNNDAAQLISSVSDNSGSGTWVLLGEANSSVFDAKWWYKIANGSETTVTTTFTNSWAYDAVAAKVTGWTNTATLEDVDEDTSYLTTATTTSIGGGSVTNATASAMALMFVANDGSSLMDAGRSVSDGASYSEVVTSGAQIFLWAHAKSSTGTYSPVYSFTDSGDQAYGASAVFGDASGSGSLNVSATTDALTLAEYAATVSYGRNVAATTDALTLTEYPATLGSTHNVNATTDALTLAEYPAAIGLSLNISATVDALTLTEYGATISDASAPEVAPVTGGHYFPRVTVNDWRERSAKQRREYLERLLGLAEELPEAVEEEVEALIEAQGVETPAQVVRLDVVRVNRLIAQIEQIIEDEDETLFLLMAS